MKLSAWAGESEWRPGEFRTSILSRFNDPPIPSFKSPSEPAKCRTGIRQAGPGTIATHIL
eukprot:7827722-Pyramimonas_sp.AAC.2